MRDILITSLETISGFDMTTGLPLFMLDELQSASIANTEEKQDLTGKQGRKLSSLKKNKAVTVSGNNGILSGGLMERQVGGSFENKATEVMWRDYLVVKTNEATINFKASGAVGSEIISVTLKNSDGTLGKTLTQSAEPNSDVFKYEASSKKLTFSSVSDGTEIVVCYKRKITADVLSNMSDKYSTKCMMYIDAMGEDVCGNVYRVQFYIPKADFSGEFSIEMGDNQTVHAFTAEALAGGCGGSKALWTYTVFGADAEDA